MASAIIRLHFSYSCKFGKKNIYSLSTRWRYLHAVPYMGVVTFFSNTPAVIADATLLAGRIALVIIYFCDVANQYITYVMLAIVSFSLNMHGLFNGRIYKTTKYKRTRRVENHE